MATALINTVKNYDEWTDDVFRKRTSFQVLLRHNASWHLALGLRPEVFYRGRRGSEDPMCGTSPGMARPGPIAALKAARIRTRSAPMLGSTQSVNRPPPRVVRAIHATSSSGHLRQLPDTDR